MDILLRNHASAEETVQSSFAIQRLSGEWFLCRCDPFKLQLDHLSDGAREGRIQPGIRTRVIACAARVLANGAGKNLRNRFRVTRARQTPRENAHLRLRGKRSTRWIERLRRGNQGLRLGQVIGAADKYLLFGLFGDLSTTIFRLKGHVYQAQQVLRRLVKGRLTFSPQADWLLHVRRSWDCASDAGWCNTYVGVPNRGRRFTRCVWGGRAAGRRRRWTDERSGGENPSPKSTSDNERVFS